MKVGNLLSALVLLATLLLPSEANAARPMIQCEACSTYGQMKSVAIQRGEGEYFVFSLTNGLVLRFIVEYDRETQMYFVRSPVPGSTMEEAFALMLDANQLKPGIFKGQQTIIGDIGKLTGGPHDPVGISLNGTHDSAYGSFIYFAKSCLSSTGCAKSINPALGKISGAEFLLNSIGISILNNAPLSGNINWQSVPPSFELWLCNENSDCALLKFENNEWKYVESRAQRGLGKRYPKYGESLNYKFNSSGEAGIFDRGLRNGGAHVSGGYSSTKTVLACASSGGATYCEYVTFLE